MEPPTEARGQGFGEGIVRMTIFFMFVGLTMLASKQGLLLSFPSKFSYKAKSKLT
jgi:hypothetical protein